MCSSGPRFSGSPGRTRWPPIPSRAGSATSGTSSMEPSWPSPWRAPSCSRCTRSACTSTAIARCSKAAGEARNRHHPHGAAARVHRGLERRRAGPRPGRRGGRDHPPRHSRRSAGRHPRRPGPRPRVVLSRTMRTTGVPESALAERLGAIETEIAPLTLAYLPSTDGVDLRLTAWSLEQGDAETRLATAAGRLQQLAGEHWYGDDGADLAAVVLEALRRKRQRLGVAESCTGGMVAERITNIPGASDTFIGGVVAYADVIKTAALRVPLETLQAHGSVSEETVRAMAEGAQRLFSTEASIAVTRIAGPGGGTPEKPVGTVWLAARGHTTTRAGRRVLPGGRDENPPRSAQAAPHLLRRPPPAPRCRRS